jgi:hypothetical protein
MAMEGIEEAYTLSLKTEVTHVTASGIDVVSTTARTLFR